MPALQPESRLIPGWQTLLFIYGIFLVPVLFSFLVGMNLLAWSRARINYQFIFGKSLHSKLFASYRNIYVELKVRTRLDYREYFEV
jgi:xenotropic and polytropic retrovirus receptor 1